MRSSLLKAATIAVTSLLCSTASAADVTINPSATWIGYMNVFELPSNGGAFVFGNPWGFADLNASFAGPVLTLTPNTSIARDVPLSDSFWWKPDTTGNKSMEANSYVQDDSGSLSGTALTFSGSVVSNTLVAPYSVMAFIKDFAPDYSSNVSTFAPVTSGNFSVSLNTDPGAGRHIQYGFALTGPNAKLTDQFGNIQLTAGTVIPEPASMGFVAVAGLLAVRRRRNG